jgi:RimK family alpha-L-glutamate ligase
MKRVLLLTSRMTPRIRSFKDLIQKELGEGTVEIVIQQITKSLFNIESGKVEVILEDGKRLRDFDLVLFRGIVTDNLLLATSLGLILKKAGIKFFDTVFGNLGPSRNKFVSLVQLALQGLPIPKSVFFTARNSLSISEKFKHLENTLGMPCVIKHIALHRGKGLSLIKTEADFEQVVREADGQIEKFLFQEFLERKQEYRLLVLGEEVAVFEEKIPKSDEWRANVALGAREVFLSVNDVPPEIKKLALETAHTAECQMAGVDIFADSKDALYVLETNRGPGLTREEASHSPEFIAFENFIQKNL